MPKFMRKPGRPAPGSADATSVRVVVRPPLAESALIPHGAVLRELIRHAASLHDAAELVVILRSLDHDALLRRVEPDEEAAGAP
jgi:hypothetical protein